MEEFASQYELMRHTVDVEFFKPSLSRCRLNNLVFDAALDQPENEDAVHYFVSEILPLVRSELPDVLFTIAGSNPPPPIEAYGNLPGINVTGTVGDTRPYVHGARVYVAPLKLDNATTSVLQALAMGKAIVSTSKAVEGLDVENGKHLAIADDPRTFAREVVSLLRNSPRRSGMETSAREKAENDFSGEKAGQMLSKACSTAAGK